MASEEGGTEGGSEGGKGREAMKRLDKVKLGLDRIKKFNGLKSQCYTLCCDAY